MSSRLKAELFVEKMRPPLRLILGLAAAAALFHFAACQHHAHADALGEVRAAAATELRPAVVPAEARWDDSDSDGIPDREELQTFGDRENFRTWFTSIAEQQFYEPSKEWSEDQRDCAGRRDHQYGIP